MKTNRRMLLRITFPTVLDANTEVTRRYEVFGLPNSIVIDANGVVRSRVVGPFLLDQMREQLAQVRQGQDVQAPRVVSVCAAMAAQNQQPAGEAYETAITLGEVNRRVDLESALTAVRGGLAQDLTRPEHAADLRRLQRALAERMVEERIVARRAAAVGIDVPDADVAVELARTAEDALVPLDRLASELAANGSDIDVLRETHRAALLNARYVAERVLSGRNEERTDDYEQWLAMAQRSAGARVDLPE